MTNPEYPLNVMQARAALADPESVVEDSYGFWWRWHLNVNIEWSTDKGTTWYLNKMNPHPSITYRLLPKEEEGPAPSGLKALEERVERLEEVARFTEGIRHTMLKQWLATPGGSGDE